MKFAIGAVVMFSQDKYLAFEKLMRRLAQSGAGAVAYGTAILAMISLTPEIQLPPTLASLVGGIGVNILSNIIERIAKGEEISNNELFSQLEIASEDLKKTLTRDDFFSAYSHLLGKFQDNHTEHKVIISKIEDVVKSINLNLQASKTPKSINQLPTPPLDFTGRESELAQLRKNIENGVLISCIQGMGGIGKTALGLKFAEQITPQYPEGQIFLDLRGAHEQTPLKPEQVMTHVILSFNPEAELSNDLGAMYRSVLNHKKVLLFYDNVRDEKQLSPLLPPMGCMLLITSREHFTLPRLHSINLDSLNFEDAFNLMKEIAPEVSDEDASVLAKQCGYLPLAIRAAVSALVLRPDWSVTDLLERLNESKTRLELVENSLSLSYDALETDLQKYLRQLGMFASPFDKNTVLMVWDVDEGTDIDTIIGELLKTSILSFNKEIGMYYLHDLTSLFLEKRFLEDTNSIHTMNKYAKSYVIRLKEWLSYLNNIKYRFEFIAHYVSENELILEAYAPKNRQRNLNSILDMILYPRKKIKFVERVYTWQTSLEPAEENLNIDFSQYLEEITYLLRKSIASFRNLYRDDITKVAEKYYTRNSSSLPLIWSLSRETYNDCAAKLRKLQRNLKFKRSRFFKTKRAQQNLYESLLIIEDIERIVLGYINQVS